MVNLKSRVFIIAEAGVNHNGDLALAKKLVEAAATAGADAVKFQTFKASNLVSKIAPLAEYQKQNTAQEESQFEMLQRLELSEEAFRELKNFCFEKDILFLSTPFDVESLELLDRLEVPFFKVPSGEITNLPFLRAIAQKKKPMIVSTGMATLAEVKEAVAAIRHAGNGDIILLQCVSSYPADPADANLRAMLTLKDAFGLPVGFSDHTAGIEVALAAAALGAHVIEKHFTLDKNLPGPDHKASLNPEELRALVKGIRKVEAALGDGEKKPSAAECNVMEAARKSLVAACDIPEGVVLTEKMIAIKRPGNGLKPALFEQLIGRKTKKNFFEGELFSWEALEK